ncbi:MAG: O-antigen ligase domain-containing protein, partial [Pseudomonadota bacterium]
DNFWLVNAVRYGIPGFLLIAAGWVWAIARIIRRPFNADRRVMLIRRAYVFTFIGLTLTLCTVHVWTNIFSFVFFVFGAGAWLVHWPTDARDTVAKTPAADPRPGLAYTRFPARATARPYARQPNMQTR